MPELLRNNLGIIAVWVPGLLAVLALVCAIGLANFWRRNRLLPLRTFVWRIWKSWWFQGASLSIIALFLLKVQCAPMTNSLAALQEGKNENIPDLAFRCDAFGIMEYEAFESNIRPSL